MNVPATNTMIVLTIRSVTTLKDLTLALVKMVTMTCRDLILYRAEFVQVITKYGIICTPHIRIRIVLK